MGDLPGSPGAAPFCFDNVPDDSTCTNVNVTAHASRWDVSSSSRRWACVLVRVALGGECGWRRPLCGPRLYPRRRYRGHAALAPRRPSRPHHAEQRVCGCLTAASVLVSLASTPSVDVDGAALSRAVPSSTWWTSMASLSFLELRRVVGPTYLSALRPRCDRWKAFPVHDTPRNGADDAVGFASKV